MYGGRSPTFIGRQCLKYPEVVSLIFQSTKELLQSMTFYETKSMRAQFERVITLPSTGKVYYAHIVF